VSCNARHALILAGDTLFAGATDKITAYDSATGEVVWETAVDGAAHGLAVANGRLFVSTDKGLIYAFE
jgi:outer membrane protein assembly factor BamB